MDTLEKCSLLSLVVAHEARLVDWCCCATFFLHVQQGGFAHTLIMVSTSPRADALRSNVCVPTCWRDCWTRVRMIVVGGRRDPRHHYTFVIHYPRRFTMCGHVRWKGPVHYQHVVPKGAGCVLLKLARRPPSTLQLASKRCVGQWRRPAALPYQCGRLQRESCCFSQTRFQRS